MKVEIKCKKCKKNDAWVNAEQIPGWGTNLKCECGYLSDTGFTKVELEK